MSQQPVSFRWRETDEEARQRWEELLEQRSTQAEAAREAVTVGLEQILEEKKRAEVPVGVEKALDFSTIASTIAILFGLAAGLGLVDYAAGVTVGMVFAGLGLVALWAAWSGRAAALDEVLLRGGGGG